MKKFTVLFSAIVMVAVIAICIYIQDRDSIDSVKFIVDADNGVTQSVNLFCNDGKYYAFLPSYADFDTIKIQYNAASLFLDGKCYNSNSSFSEIVTEKEYSLELRNFLGISVCNTSLTIMKSEYIPSLFISLSDGKLKDINNSLDKSVNKSGICTVINNDALIDFSGGFQGLKGRGNLTWSANKKSYNLSFSQAVDLLDMGLNKKYCLLANAFDNSKLRNKIAYDIAKKMDIKYSVDSRFVDLYIDNEYLGLYLLSESIDVDEYRININELENETQKKNSIPLYKYEQFEEYTYDNKLKGISIPNNPSDITGGYLIESDSLYRDEQHTNTFTMNYKDMYNLDSLFSVKYPSCTSKEQMLFISNQFNNMVNSFNNDYEQYI